nr:hypothetical protein [Mycobacterium eburneum]
MKAERGWLALAGFVAGWDATCEPGQMLTDGARRHPVATWIGVLLVGGHLTETLPPRLDLLHGAALLLRRVTWTHPPKSRRP